MTTVELEQAVARWVDKTGIAAFAAAANDLAERDRRRGGDGKLRDVMVSLADDRKTVIVYSNWSDDARTMVASFTLPEPLPAGEKFNAAFYEKMLR